MKIKILLNPKTFFYIMNIIKKNANFKSFKKNSENVINN